MSGIDGKSNLSDAPTRSDPDGDVLEVSMPCCGRSRRFPAFPAPNWSRKIICPCGRKWRVSRAKDGRFLFGEP